MTVRVLFAALLLIGGPSAPAGASCSGGVTMSFTVTGEVAKPSVFYLNNLEQLPVAQANVTYFAAGSVVSQSFTGALLWDLLNNPPVGGIVTDPSVKNHILHKIVIVTGSDCYQSVFGAGEFDPFFGGSQGRQQHGRQDGNDGNHHQQFNQSKAASSYCSKAKHIIHSRSQRSTCWGAARMPEVFFS